MTMLQRFLIPGLALLSLGLGGYAYQQRAERLAAEDRLRALEDKMAALNKATPAPQPSWPAASTGPVATPSPALESTGPTPRFPTGGPATTAAAGPRSRSDMMAMMDSPEMQQLVSLQFRRMLDTRYAALFKNLKLSPDKLDEFQHLLEEKQNTMRDVVAAMRSQGLTPGRDNADEMQTLVRNANAEIESQIRSTLGESAYAQYQTYETSQPQRATVDRVQQRLSYSGQPLTDQQASQLLNLMIQASPPPAAETNNGSGGNSLRRVVSSGMGLDSAPITPQVLAQASGVLSSTQLAALQEIQLEQEAQMQLSRRARDNFSAGRPASTGR